MDSISRVVLYTKQNELNRLLKDAFVISGVSSVKISMPKDLDACLRATRGKGLSYIVLSDDLGFYELNRALEALTKEVTKSTSPIMVIAKNKDPKIYSLMVEYDVGEYYSENLEKNKIRKAIKNFMSAAPLTPELGRFLNRISDKLEDNDLLSASKMYESALLELPTNNYKIRIKLAEIYFQMQEYSKAKDVLALIDEDDKRDPKYCYLMARIAVKSGSMTEASEYFEMCQFLNPNNIVTLINIGAQYLNAGDDESAKMVFEDVLLIDDQCQDAIVGLGVCKLTSGEIDEGIRLIGNSINNRENAHTSILRPYAL